MKLAKDVKNMYVWLSLVDVGAFGNFFFLTVFPSCHV